MKQEQGRLRRVVEIILALVLITAAILKAWQLFTYSIYFPTSQFLSPMLQTVLIQVELLLGIWLLTGSWSGPRFIAVLLCFSLYSVVTAYETLQASPSCGCFGFVSVPPWLTLTFDLSAVIGLWLTRPRSISLGDIWPSGIRLIGGITLALSAIPALWSFYFIQIHSARTKVNLFSLNTGSVVVMDATAMLHKPFSLFGEIQGATALKKGKWLVIFYHYDCQTCLRAIPNYRSLAVADNEMVNSERVAFIAIPPLAPPGEDPIGRSSFYLHLNLNPDHQWLAMTPLVIALKDGRVITAKQGEKAIEPSNLLNGLKEWHVNAQQQ